MALPNGKSYDPYYDLNGDASIDIVDIVLFRVGYGRVCYPT